MGFAMRRHILINYPEGARRTWSAAGAGLCGALGFIVFVSQIFGKWAEGGWIRLLAFTIFFMIAHLLLVSPIGYRSPGQIYRIVRTKARIQSGMASIVEWQSLKMQEYRYHLLVAVHSFWALFGVRRSIRMVPPPEACDYDHALHADHPEYPSFLLDYMDKAERDQVANPIMSSRLLNKRRKKHAVPEYDRFTWYSLVAVGIIFTIALNQYLVDIHASLDIHTLAIAVPLILLVVYVFLLRSRRNHVKDRGSHRIPLKDTGD
jgi:hypothetical protein